MNISSGPEQNVLDTYSRENGWRRERLSGGERDGASGERDGTDDKDEA
jgi:hypothetical protein